MGPSDLEKLVEIVFAQAEDLLGKGDARQALTLLEGIPSLGGFREMQCRVHALKGTALMLLSKFHDSEHQLDKACQIAKSVSSNKLIADAELRRGSLLFRMREMAKAEVAFKNAKEAARADENRFLEASAYAGEGKILLQLGKNQEALDTFAKGIAVADSLQHPHLKAKLQGELACGQWKLGLLNEAEASYRQAAEACTELGKLADLHILLAGLGTIFQSRKQYDEATSYYIRAADLAQSLGDTHSTARWTNNLALTYLESGEKTMAAEANTKACELYRQVGDKQGQLGCMSVAVSLGLPPP